MQASSEVCLLPSGGDRSEQVKQGPPRTSCALTWCPPWWQLSRRHSPGRGRSAPPESALRTWKPAGVCAKRSLLLGSGTPLTGPRWAMASTVRNQTVPHLVLLTTLSQATRR